MRYEKIRTIHLGGYASEGCLHVDYELKTEKEHNDERIVAAHVAISDIANEMRFHFSMNCDNAEPIDILPACSYAEAYEQGYCANASKVRSLVRHAIILMDECEEGNFDVLDDTALEGFDDLLVTYKETTSASKSLAD